MKFEEALKAMREGKKVKRPVNLLPRAMKDGKICDVWKRANGKLVYEPLETMYCSNIIAGDWEIVDE